MCGIIGLLLANEEERVNQALFDGLTVLQHRGQDAAGMMTVDQGRLRLRKDNGMVRDVFQLEHMTQLKGNIGIGHVRYPTAGSSSNEEAQPFSTTYPFGIGVAHNGNLTNTEELSLGLQCQDFRHVNTDSDSEVLLNVFAEALTKELKSDEPRESMADVVFQSMEEVMQKCQGGFAGVYLINGFGLVGFRDPYGIRPLVFGVRKSSAPVETKTTQFDSDGLPMTPGAMGDANKKLDFCIASESVVIDSLGFKLIRDVRAGEAIFVDMDGNCHSKVVHSSPTHSPCIFEYVYFARPDSIMDGVSVYEARLNMGEKLAEQILEKYPDHDIDVVIPVPDTSRVSALQAAYRLNKPFREGFMKNRYIGRTFIMPGQAKRKKSVRLKLNTVKTEFEGKNVLLVDDSIVRGTTAGEIVQMARDAGAKNVYFSSAAPPIRYPNIYGIDLPTQQELIAYERNEEEIAHEIGCDWVLYQRLEDLEASIREALPKKRQHTTAPGGATQDSETNAATFTSFDTSTFSGCYVTGQRMGDEYFQRLHEKRNDMAKRAGGAQRRPSTGSSMSGGRPAIANDFVRNNWAVPAAAPSSKTSDTEETKSDSLSAGSGGINDQTIRVVEKIPLPTF
mmetsp:Transcript_24395/g.57814  ORF Transcript_24395/g.57814 Transcript_24395/m.57814 type:complete len:618 (+) Transcript_24395:477-2330(+)